MHRLARPILTALFLALVSFAGSAYAQSSQTIKAHIPFEFNVGDKTFPAGDYSIVQPLENHRTIMVLKNDSGETIASMFTNEVWSAKPPATPVFRFYVSDGQPTLAEIWRPENGSYGQEVTPKPRMSFSNRHTDDTDAVVAGSQP